MTLHVESQGLLSGTFELSENGRPAGRIHLRSASKGHLILDGMEWDVRRERAFSRTFVLEQNGRSVARATRTGWFRPAYEVKGEDRRLTLRTAGFSIARFRVLHGDREIGTIARTKLFGRDADADFQEHVPPGLRAFLLFLALATWRRQRQAAAGGG